MRSTPSRLRASRSSTPSPAAPGAEAAIFRREGEYWTIAYHGVILRLRDAKGLRYLAWLLCHPGQRISAAHLIRTDASPYSGAPQAPSSDEERARLAVTKRVKSAVRKIGDHHPALGYHLSAGIKTGA